MTLTGLDTGAGLAAFCVEMTEETALDWGFTPNLRTKYSSSQLNNVSLS